MRAQMGQVIHSKIQKVQKPLPLLNSRNGVLAKILARGATRVGGGQTTSATPLAPPADIPTPHLSNQLRSKRGDLLLFSLPCAAASEASSEFPIWARQCLLIKESGAWTSNSETIPLGWEFWADRYIWVTAPPSLALFTWGRMLLLFSC